MLNAVEEISYMPFGSLLKNIVDNRGRTCPTTDNGIPLIATNCIKTENLYPVFERVRYVSKETYNTWFRGHPIPGDIIFVNKGTPGRVCLVPNPINFCIAQDMVAIRPDDEKIYPKYLFSALRSENIQAEIENLHVGSLIPHFKKSDFDILKIPIPNRSTQVVIGDLYFSISKKIDLLTRQNKTLEGIAETLFRHSFQIEGNNTVTLENYVDCINGYSYKSSELNPSKNALVTLKNFDRNGGFRLDGFKEFTGKVKEPQTVKEGDLVVAHTDITQEAEVIGNPALIIADPNYDVMVITMDLVKVLPKFDWLSIEFLYFLMRSREFKFHCLGCSNGTTVLHLSKKAIPTFEFQKPDRATVEQFTAQAKPLIQKVFSNHRQIKTLTQLRDNLLPKLMSGEASIKMN